MLTVFNITFFDNYIFSRGHVRGYFLCSTFIFTCAYAYQATCACKSCAIDYEHNMIMMKRIYLYTVLILFRFVRRDYNFDHVRLSNKSSLLSANITAFVLFCRSILNTQGKKLLCANNNTIILPFKLNLYFKFVATGSKFDPMPSRLQRAS